MDECLTYYDKPPEYTYQVSKLSQVERYCIGMDFNDLESWKAYWVNKEGSHANCTEVFYNNIYDTVDRKYSSEGMQKTQANFQYIFNTYFQRNAPNSKGGHVISSPGLTNYDDFQQILVNACSNNPEFQLWGVCQVAAREMCTCNSTITSSNTDLLKVCGCQVTSLDRSTGEYDGVPEACDPLCVHDTVVKNINLVTGVVDTCNSSTCIINNVSIVVTDSLVGSSNFMQVCPQCSNGGVCTCILDTTVSSTSQDVGIYNNITYNQYCGPNSICLQVGINSSTGVEETVVVPCSDSFEESVPIEYPINVPYVVWVLLAIIIIVFCVVVGCILQSAKNDKLLNSTSTNPK